MKEMNFWQTCPVFRSFDEAKAREFYLDWLGFDLLFEHRFHPGAPLYMGIGRSGLILHISEHHGDATPGSTVFVRMRGIRQFHEEVSGRPYANNRPSLQELAWGLEMEVIDPFGNRIRFCEDGE